MKISRVFLAPDYLCLYSQDSEDVGPPEVGGLRRRRTIKKKKRVCSFFF